VVALSARKNESKAASAAKTPVISLDAGNGYFKLVAPNGAHVSFPAAVKRLKSYEVDEARPDSTSAIIALGGVTYAFGSVAVQMGGKSLFEVGKSAHTPVAVAAAIAFSGLGHCPAVKLRLLVPDASKAEWKEVGKSLAENLKEFSAEVDDGQGTQRFLPRIDDVQLVSEGRPVWAYAQRAGLIPAQLRNRELTGVIDAGTGDLTCTVWTRSGSPVREGGVSFSTPAMQALAGSIAAGFSAKTTYTPSRSTILEIIRQQGQVRPADRLYVYEESGQAHDFTDILQEEIKDWNRELLVSLQRDRWATVWSQLGMVFITGGASDLLLPMEKATKGRFKILRLEHTQPQMINAALMAYLG